MTSNSETGAEKSKNFSRYVGSYYDNLNKKIPTSYSDWKWFRSKSSIFQYNQTKKAIQKAIGGHTYNRALEVGPGDGIWTELLTKYCSNIEAIDLSEKMLEMAKIRLMGKNVRFIHGNFLTKKINGNKNLIYSIRCIEYLPDKERVIRKFYFLLKNNADLIIITKNPHFLRLRKQDKKLHSRQIDIIALRDILKKEGFRNIQIYPAVFGKGFHFPFLRQISAYFHNKILIKDKKKISLIVKYLTESFLIHAKK